MCGIVGYVGHRIADRVLIDGLKRLEYRGYDSSGIAVIEHDALLVKRSVGKLINLEELLAEARLTSRIGLGHTRWATHGKPTEANAHPHVSHNNTIVVVHNGIIENYLALKAVLKKKYTFTSETDTEVMAHLIEDEYAACISRHEKEPLLHAVRAAVKKVVGSYALGVLCINEPDTIVAARKSSPLVLGIGENESFIASDVPAILSYTNTMIILDDDETALLKKDRVTVYNKEGNEVKKKITIINWDPVLAEKGGYKHFMLKEIFEQPETLRDTIRGRVNLDACDVEFDHVGLSERECREINKILIIACGTSYHAGLVGKFLFEDCAGISCEIDIGSEFRYRNHRLNEQCLVIAISQSGETADTLASFRAAKKTGARDMVICNVIDSSLARDATHVVYTRCGPEIGVASTKAFTGQLCALYLVALFLGKRRGVLDKDTMVRHLTSLIEMPERVEETLQSTKDVMEEWARHFFKKNSFLFLGRNLQFPIALEGALKLKEISYIHAEGYAAGEMKHGPIALIDENMPVLAIATESPVYEKMVSNIAEAKARDGIILALATQGDVEIRDKAEYVCYVPKVDPLFSPLVTIIPLQLLAYFIAEKRGCDVDQPRNLAKSVTVE